MADIFNLSNQIITDLDLIIEKNGKELARIDNLQRTEKSVGIEETVKTERVDYSVSPSGDEYYDKHIWVRK